MTTPTLFDYLSKEEATAICKLAEDATAPAQTGTLKPLLAGMAGMGIGTLAGAGAADLSNRLYKHVSGKNIPHSALLTAAPVLGAGLGLAYNLAQGHQREEIRRAREGSDNKS